MTAADLLRPPDYPRWLERELRSDHAGETGAVAIYRGVLAVTRDDAARGFARRHMKSEQAHLNTVTELLLPQQRSRLLSVWKFAGFLTGAIPALFGSNAIYATIDAVETFVDKHYRQQIEQLGADPAWASLKSTLESLRLDEVAHRDEARQERSRSSGLLVRGWLWAVSHGSALAVSLARRV